MTTVQWPNNVSLVLLREIWEAALAENPNMTVREFLDMVRKIFPEKESA